MTMSSCSHISAGICIVSGRLLELPLCSAYVQVGCIAHTEAYELCLESHACNAVEFLTDEPTSSDCVARYPLHRTLVKHQQPS